VSTGQGLLGNNMFAYCNNNPVNYSDPSGKALTPTHIHNAVVDDIIRHNPGKTKTSPKILYYATYYGREYGLCDVYDINTGEVWDVKRYKGGTTCSPSAATRQLENYTNNGYLKALPGLSLTKGGTYTTIPANVFKVRDDLGKQTYVIGYWDAGIYDSVAGIVYYDYICIRDPELSSGAASIGLGVLGLMGLSYLITPVQYPGHSGPGCPRPA